MRDNTLAIVLGLGVVAVGLWWMFRQRVGGSGYTSAGLALPGLFYEDDPALSAYLPSDRGPYATVQQRVSEPTFRPYQSTPNPTGARVTQTATAAGLGTTAAIAAPGAVSTAALAIPLVGAGVGLLTWGILDQGWFRGGEEALDVNPARDQWFSQFGPPGTDVGSGFHNVAAQLTEWGYGAGGGQPFAAVAQADTMDTFVPATRAIRAIYAQHGQSIFAY